MPADGTQPVGYVPSPESDRLTPTDRAPDQAGISHTYELLATQGCKNLGHKNKAL